jgi:hypothetical protein
VIDKKEKKKTPDKQFKKSQIYMQTEGGVTSKPMLKKLASTPAYKSSNHALFVA